MTQLRDYQIAGTDQVLACLMRGESVARQLPTGGGKGVEIAHIVSQTLPLGWEWNVTCHRREIARQLSGHLKNEGIDHGIIAPGHSLTSHRVHVTSIDTVVNRLDELDSWLRRTRGLPDEVQHAPANNWDKVLRRSIQLAGFTATPCRLDGRGLADEGLFDRLVLGPSIKRLQADGWLAEALVYAPPVGLDFSLIGKRGGDFVLKQIAQMVDTPEFTAKALLWYARICSGKPCMIFCTTVEHAENVALAFRNAGWRARSVDGDMSQTERDAAIGGLGTGSVQVLTSCMLVGEGLDIPAVCAAILLRPTWSTMLYLQQIGRTLRPHEDKTFAYIIDLVGNTARHGYYAADRQWSLDGGLRGIERAVAGTWRCPRCYLVREQDGAESMQCLCGNKSRFISSEVDAHPPIAGVSAERLVTMLHIDAVKLLHEPGDLLLYAKLKKMPHPKRFVQNMLASRGQ